MNGRKARELRRSELPPDLAAEARDRIAVAVSARARAERAARTAWLARVREADAERDAAVAAARATFQEAETAVHAEFRQRAADRAAGGETQT